MLCSSCSLYSDGGGAKWTSWQRDGNRSAIQLYRASLATLQSESRSVVTDPIEACLTNVTVLGVGMSEMLNLIEWLQLRLPYCKSDMGAFDRFTQCSRRTHGSRDPSADARCKEDLYAATPFVSSCASRATRNVTTLHFEWKTSMFAPRDLTFRARVAEAAARRRAVLLLLSGGVAHFTQLTGYLTGLSGPFNDSFMWPQPWLDNYVNSTMALFRLFTPRVALSQHICVLWVAHKIGPRHNGSQPHHPSTINGATHWLNRFTNALAQLHGIGVVDVTDLTSTIQPAGDHKAPPFRFADAEGRNASEGDPYHGFPPRVFEAQMTRACEQCGLYPKV